MLVSRCSKWSIPVSDVFIELDLQGVTARLVTCCLFHTVILDLSEWDCRGLSSGWAQQDPAHLPASQRLGHRASSCHLLHSGPTRQGTP